jgi:N-acetylglucosaminyl-diphospho-decaprenol L-rhamnosyltransferase
MLHEPICIQTQHGRVQNPSGASLPAIGVIVVSFNTQEHLAACLESIQSQDYSGSAHVVVVDNASLDGSSKMVADHFPEATLIANTENRGFAAANNQAFVTIDADLICLVNPDALLRTDALSNAVNHMLRNPETGICGGLLVDENGKRHPSARRFPNALGKLLTLSGISSRFPKSRVLAGQNYEWFNHDTAIEVDWVPGAFTCIRRDLIEDIGFFDERYFLYYEETDLCLRAKRHGWRIDLVPNAVIEHEGGASSKTVKDESFDVGGAQLLKFRTRAECLYHRKNFGLVSLLANLGGEWLWHGTRRLVNFRPGSGRAAKRAYSRQIQASILAALKDTAFGTACPPRPW